MKGPIAPPVAQTPLSPIRLFRWARQSISGIAGSFYLITVLALATNVVTQYNAQLIANFIGQAQRQGAVSETTAPKTQPASPGEGTQQTSAAPSAKSQAKSGGGFHFMDYLLPNDTRLTAALFALTALIVIALAFANRVGTVWINTLMLRGLQIRLHDKLIRLGPTYHAEHDMGENTAVIMQYTAGAQPMLRDTLTFPLVRGVSLATAILFLFYNLSDLRGQSGVIYALLAVLLIVLPLGGWWLSGKLRGAYSAVRERVTEVNNTLVELADGAAGSGADECRAAPLGRVPREAQRPCRRANPRRDPGREGESVPGGGADGTCRSGSSFGRFSASAATRCRPWSASIFSCRAWCSRSRT